MRCGESFYLQEERKGWLRREIESRWYWKGVHGRMGSKRGEVYNGGVKNKRCKCEKSIARGSWSAGGRERIKGK